MTSKTPNNPGGVHEIHPAQSGLDVERPRSGSGYDASLAVAVEKREEQMTFMEAIRNDKRLIWYSLGFSGTIIMEGYGLAMITFFFSFRSFAKQFGEYNPTKDNAEQDGYSISLQWQMILPIVAQVGSLIGVALAPPVADKLGYKKTALVMIFLAAALTCVPFFAKNIEMFVAAFLLQGIPWGVFQVIAPAYASEIASVQLRPVLTTWNNLCWVIGQFIASGVGKGFNMMDGDMAYRIPFALQWIFTVILFIVVSFAPESPYWYLQRDRNSDARMAIKKLVRKGADQAVEDKYALMRHTVEQEKKQETVVLSGIQAWLGMFKGVDLRRTEIACIIWMIQALCGSNLIGWGPTFLKNAGLSNEGAYSINMAITAAGLVGTLASWWLMRYVGRRDIYFWGLVGMAALLVGCGASGFVTAKSAGWASGGILAVYTLVYDLTVGPICYSIVSEIPSIRRRAATLSAARATYLSFNFINYFLAPLMLNDTANKGWGWGPKSALLYAGVCVLGATYTFLRLPETRNISARGLDILFQNKVSARKFTAEKANDLESNQAAFQPVASHSSLNSSVSKANVNMVEKKP
ncbi:hypothetical protein OQA88_9239 [Cercophora sp. LCS_1]